jgi:two-component system, chemotaxis family, chemotaxis protein CheY
MAANENLGSSGQDSASGLAKPAGQGKDFSLNFKDLMILVADANPHARRIICSILRGFGANKLLEVENEMELLRALSLQKIDILICDERLPTHGGLRLTRAIRGNAKNENRTMPILLMTNNARESSIKRARDAGANMVVVKPMSPNSLYDRLARIALKSRKFIDTVTYFGPDRRFRNRGYPGGVGRRKGDKPIEAAAKADPAPRQGDSDSLFGAARSGTTE